VRNLCPRTLLFEGGRLRFDGPSGEALALYEAGFAQAGGKLSAAEFSGELTPDLAFDEVVLYQDGAPVTIVDPMRDFVLEVRGNAAKPIAAVDLNVSIDREGFHLGSCFDSSERSRMQPGPFVSRFRFGPDVFRAGRYTVGIGASTPSTWTWGPQVAVLDFSESHGGRPEHRVRGAVQLPYSGERLQ
jgi:hypothetical protein